MTKTAIVTGGVRGIGKGLSTKLAELGYNVVINYTSESSTPRAEQLADELKKAYGVDAIPYQADVSDHAACKKMAADVVEKYGSIDVLVNNAGITRNTPFVDMTPDQYRRVIEVNLIGYFNTCHVCLPQMFEQGEGQIVNICSISAQLPQIGLVDYAASKGGIHAFTKSLAAEVISKGVRVNQISPGSIHTEMTEQTLREYPEIVRNFEATIPMKRSGTPEEIAWALEYLLKATYVVGENVSVNGGSFMQ